MRALVLGFLVCLTLVAPVFADPPSTDPHAQIEQSKPSGFWGKGERGPGAYRWKLLGIGVVILGATGIMMMRLVRRANDERAANPR
jgi:hypothetical protein